MALPVSFTPPGDVAASGFGPMPGSFSGQARDFAGPVEFAPLPAVQVLETAGKTWPLFHEPGVVTTPPVEIVKLADLLTSGPPMVPAETAFSLQELADALARPAPAPAVIPDAPSPADFSLTALAEQLHARFSQVEPMSPESADLLSPVPPPPGLDPRPEPSPGLAALLPSLGLKPSAPARPMAAVGRLASPPKPATPRQGDVFFMDPLAGQPPGHAATPPGFPEPAPALLFEPDPMDELEALDLMDALPSSPPPPATPQAMPFRPVRTPEAKVFAIPPLPATVSLPREAAASVESGTGLILGGTGLILLGILLACRLPTFWLDLDGADTWSRQKTEAGLILHAAAAVTALTLGTGSVSLRRWAPPLIHAAGWVAALTACGIIAVAGFSWVSSETDEALSGSFPLAGLLTALLVPLGYIFYYQQESATNSCEAADPQPAWTDGLPVPALMVFLTGLSLAAGAAALLCHQPAVSLPPEQLITGLPATVACSGLGALGLGIALCVRFKKPAAIWLLLLATLALAVTVSPPALTGGWPWDRLLVALGRPADAGPSSPLVPLLAALLPVPLLLIFSMARRAFSSPPPP